MTLTLTVKQTVRLAIQAIRRAACVATCLGLLPTAAHAILAPLHIVTVGDFHTLEYAGDALKESFKTVGISVTVVDIASPTMNATDFAATSSQAGLAERILDENPDVVVFMLGTSDAMLDQFSLFQQEFPPVLRAIEAYADRRAGLTQLLVAANIPTPGDSITSGRLANQFNPFLREEANRSDWLFVDMEARLIDVSRWQRLYADGRLLTDTGYDWMTVTIRNQIMELPFPDVEEAPEPITGGTWAIGLVALTRAAQRRQRG